MYIKNKLSKCLDAIHQTPCGRFNYRLFKQSSAGSHFVRGDGSNIDDRIEEMNDPGGLVTEIC